MSLPTQPAALPEILEAIKSLEPLPQVAMRLMALAEDEEVTPRELVEVLQTDAGVTAKVLKLANSAYYGFQRKIASLEEAGNLLGTRTLFNLVLTSCAGRYFRDLGGCDVRTAEKLWERTVLNAVCASLLARLSGGADRHRAYTVGLLQNIGDTVLARFVVPVQSLVDAERARGADPLELEERLFGMSHPEIGAQLAARWNFPEVLVDTIRHHHAPERAQVDPLLASFCSLAETITGALDLDGGLEHVEVDWSGDLLRKAGLDLQGLTSIEDVLLAELRRAREFVAIG